MKTVLITTLLLAVVLSETTGELIMARLYYTKCIYNQLTCHLRIASDCMSGELQLLTDNTTNICIEETWRTLCRDNNGNNEWARHAPNVACKQLGYREQGIAT